MSPASDGTVVTTRDDKTTPITGSTPDPLTAVDVGGVWQQNLRITILSERPHTERGREGEREGGREGEKVKSDDIHGVEECTNWDNPLAEAHIN